MTLRSHLPRYTVFQYSVCHTPCPPGWSFALYAPWPKQSTCLNRPWSRSLRGPQHSSGPHISSSLSFLAKLVPNYSPSLIQFVDHLHHHWPLLEKMSSQTLPFLSSENGTIREQDPTKQSRNMGVTLDNILSFIPTTSPIEKSSPRLAQSKFYLHHHNFSNSGHRHSSSG